jgi:hypothetical protein
MPLDMIEMSTEGVDRKNTSSWILSSDRCNHDS